MRGLLLHLLKGSGTLLLAALAGCGGRSSTFESDGVDVEASGPSAGGSNGKGTGAGATTGVGAATGVGAPTGSGSAGAPSPSSGGAAGSAAGSSQPGTSMGKGGTA